MGATSPTIDALLVTIIAPEIEIFTVQFEPLVYSGAFIKLLIRSRHEIAILRRSDQ